MNVLDIIMQNMNITVKFNKGQTRRIIFREIK